MTFLDRKRFSPVLLALRHCSPFSCRFHFQSRENEDTQWSHQLLLPLRSIIYSGNWLSLPAALMIQPKDYEMGWNSVCDFISLLFFRMSHRLLSIGWILPILVISATNDQNIPLCNTCLLNQLWLCPHDATVLLLVRTKAVMDLMDLRQSATRTDS